MIHQHMGIEYYCTSKFFRVPPVFFGAFVVFVATARILVRCPKAVHLPYFYSSGCDKASIMKITLTLWGMMMREKEHKGVTL